MGRITRFLTLLLFTVSFSAFSALGNHPIVLIHGFQAGQLQTHPDSKTVSSDGANYWRDFWLAKADARIDWPSQERITGKISSDYLWPALKELSEKNTCNNGCILVTHSTGDLVARYILDNQDNWLHSAGLKPLNIVATFDFAGAGGGSELADVAINVSEGGGSFNSAMQYAISLWLGEYPDANNTGVLNDLKVENARQLAPLPSGRVPRIRFAGNGSDFWSATSGFLPGNDDGVVSAHSSCGSSKAGSYSSCSSEVGFNGEVSGQSDAVTQFMPNHFPLMMGDDYSHGGLIGNVWKGTVTAAAPSVAMKNGIKLNVDTKDEWSWLAWGTYRYVKGSENKTISELAAELVP